MEQARPGHPLSDDELLELGQHCYRAADRAEATEREFAAFPAILPRLREKVEVARHTDGQSVLDLRDCIQVIDDGQIELWPAAG